MLVFLQKEFILSALNSILHGYFLIFKVSGVYSCPLK